MYRKLHLKWEFLIFDFKIWTKNFETEMWNYRGEPAGDVDDNVLYWNRFANKNVRNVFLVFKITVLP